MEDGMKTYTVMDTEGQIHTVEAEGYGFHDVDCMMEFQVGGDLVFAIPAGKIAWIKVKLPIPVGI